MGDYPGWGVPQLFVYGLLRPGQRYWRQLAPAVRAQRPARVRGRLYRHAGGAYPMLVAEEDGWVLGAQLTVEDAPVVHALAFMELTAGYEARWVAAYPPDRDEPSGRVVAFCWPWGETDRGAPIPGGDWLAR